MRPIGLLLNNLAMGRRGGASYQEIDATLDAGAIVPAGAEKVVNGGMELDSDWSNTGSTTINARSDAQAHSGTYSRHVATELTGYNGLNQNITHVSGRWHRLEAWVYHVSGVAVRVRWNSTEVTIGTTGEWQQQVRQQRFSSANQYIRLLSNNGATEFYADDVSILEYDPASLLFALGDIGRKTGTFICHPATDPATQCGLAVNYADDDNQVIFYIDRYTGRGVVEKCVGGAWSLVINTAITYVAGTELKLIVSGTDYSLYYGGNQVGSTTAIADDGLGTEVYGFATSAASEVGAVSTFQ